jgi:hypothetical protein
MEVKDTWKTEGGQLVRHREYPERDRVLKENAELQKSDSVKATDGLRAFARFPVGEIERIAESYPTRWGDLVNPDPKLASRAKQKLVNSSEGKEYRVGGTSRKSFRFKVNPLAKR